MKTISAEEANKISCSNNTKVIELNREIRDTIEDCMARIERSAKAGDFSAKCYCKVKHLNDIFAILKSLDYEAAIYYRRHEPLQAVSSDLMIELEVSWDCLD